MVNFMVQEGMSEENQHQKHTNLYSITSYFYYITLIVLECLNYLS